MSDTAWISVAVIVVAVALTIIVKLLRNRKEAYLKLNTKWGDFTFSPGDATRIINEYENAHEIIKRHVGDLEKTDVQELTKFNTSEGRPESEALNKIPQTSLQKLVEAKLVQDPDNPDSFSSKEALRLAYVGWQILQSYTKKRPLSDPWQWPKLEG